MPKIYQFIQIRFGQDTFRIPAYYPNQDEEAIAEATKFGHTEIEEIAKTLDPKPRSILEYFLTSPRLLSTITIREPHPQDSLKELYQPQDGIISCGDIQDNEEVLKLLSLVYTYLKFPTAAKRGHVDTRVELIAKGANPLGFKSDFLYTHEGNPIFRDYSQLDPSTEIEVQANGIARLNIPEPDFIYTSSEIYCHKVDTNGELTPITLELSSHNGISIQPRLAELFVGPTTQHIKRSIARCMGKSNVPSIMYCFKPGTPSANFIEIVNLVNSASTTNSRLPKEKNDRLALLIATTMDPHSLNKHGFSSIKTTLSGLADPRLKLILDQYGTQLSPLLFKPINPPIEPISL